MTQILILNKNLPLHRAPVIESFSLDLSRCSRLVPDQIKEWVVIAISHFLSELEIVYGYGWTKLNILPSNLYTCKSLMILKLDGKFFLDVPQMVFLPSLKTLKLERVRYLTKEYLQLLLSNCPILEDLWVYLYKKDITGKLTVFVPSLQSLAHFIPSKHDIDGFVIKTPSLEYLKLKNHYCLIENMPNLFEAYVDVELTNIKSLLGSITSVERLTICSEAMYDEGFVFNQLEHLELCTCKGLGLSLIDVHDPIGVAYWNQPSTVPDAVYILQNAVHLKTARIKSLESDVPKLETIKGIGTCF